MSSHSGRISCLDLSGAISSPPGPRMGRTPDAAIRARVMAGDDWSVLNLCSS